MSNEEENLVMRMRMYEAQAIAIEREAEIENLRRRIEEMERERLERNQGEPLLSSRDVWAAILKLEESNALQKQRVEQSERRLEESMRNIQNRLELLEERDRCTHSCKLQQFLVNRIQRRPEEITARLERNEVLNAKLLELTTLEDRINRGNETILIMGGERGGETLDEMVYLERKTSTWKMFILKLPFKNYFGGSALLNGEIYIFGGIMKKLYKLDSQQMRWIEMARMNEERGSTKNNSVVFQGCIWVFGGLNCLKGRYLNTVEKYCPERNEWIEMPGMREKRSSTAVAVCNEKIFVSGGFNGWTSLKSVECFDPTSEVWTPMVDMPGVRKEHSMTSDGSSLLVMGGLDRNYMLNTVWGIRPSKENAAWERLQPMNKERFSFTAKSLCCSTPGYKKEIYAIGGGNIGWPNQTYLDSVEIFDGERWREGPKLPNGCDSMSSVVIPSSLAERLFST